VKPFWDFGMRDDGWIFVLHAEVPKILISAPPDGWRNGFKQNAFIGDCIKKALLVEEANGQEVDSGRD
jgi:hypothetical protein